MKTLLIAVLLLVSLKCFSQKTDSIVYCQLTIWEGDNYQHYYTLEQGNKDGTSTYLEKKIACDDEIGACGKMGAKGWHLITITSDLNHLSVYIFEKTYKRE